MKRLINRLALITLVGFLGIQMSAAETISGSQTRGSAGQNATLHCNPVTIKSAKSITSISGSNQGFWIQKSTAIIARYYKENDPSAKGKKLQPGTYYVYPNLKSGQKKATVTVVIK